VIIGALAIPAGADAGTAAVSLNAVSYSAAPGERNAAAVSVTDPRGKVVTIRDSAGVMPGARCARPKPTDPTVAVCIPDLSGDLSGGATARIEAALGDGDDSILVTGPLGLEADGGAGADRLTGGPAQDTLRGGGGRDTIRGNGDDDVLNAGPGGASVFGGTGEDRLQGGTGPDVLDGGRSTDFLSGVGGNDILRARDGTPDAVYCGRGRDRADVDGVDFISSPCEGRPRGRYGAATVIDQRYRFFAPDFEEGGTNLEIGCPGDGARRCTGTVIVRRGRTLLGRGPFSVPRDRIGLAPQVKPTRAGRRLRTGKPVKATVVLVTRDRRGRRVVRTRAGSAENFPASEFE